jgi:hypothetical protein
VRKPVNRWTMLTAVALVCLAPGAAFAYVGPGASVSAIGGALALVAGAILALVGFVWYPIKRFVRFMRQTRQSAGGPPAA